MCTPCKRKKDNGSDGPHVADENRADDWGGGGTSLQRIEQHDVRDKKEEKRHDRKVQKSVIYSVN